MTYFSCCYIQWKYRLCFSYLLSNRARNERSNQVKISFYENNIDSFKIEQHIIVFIYTNNLLVICTPGFQFIKNLDFSSSILQYNAIQDTFLT